MPARWTVVQLIPALDSGGAERSTLEIAAALVAAGHRSVVISAGGRWVPRLVAGGSEHLTLAMNRKWPTALFQSLRLRRLLKDLKPDLLHVRSRLPGWLARLALIGMRPKPATVSTVHGLNSVSRYSAIMTRADRVIAVSDFTRAYWLKHYPALDPSKLRVIPRGVDPLEFNSDPPLSAEYLGDLQDEFPPLRHGKRLTLPGRGTRLKGHAEAIDLLAALDARKIDASLLLLGVIEPGREDYVRGLTKRAEDRGVLDRVAFSPARADVREIYLASDLVLQMSTRPETFGRIVTEALHLGRPVLGYDHGGVGELLREHFPAGASPPRDLDSLCERAIELLRTPQIMPAPETLPRVADLQALTLSVYAELIDCAPKHADFSPITT